MSAIAVEKNSQCPRFDSKRKWSTGCGLPPEGEFVSYLKSCLRCSSRAFALRYGRGLSVGPLVRELRDARRHLRREVEVARPRPAARGSRRSARGRRRGRRRSGGRASRSPGSGPRPRGRASRLSGSPSTACCCDAHLEGDRARRQEHDGRIDGLEVDRDPSVGRRRDGGRARACRCRRSRRGRRSRCVRSQRAAVVAIERRAAQAQREPRGRRLGQILDLEAQRDRRDRCAARRPRRGRRGRRSRPCAPSADG